MLADFSRMTRLIWIDWAAARPEGVCRADICTAFGGSTAQAVKDISVYVNLKPTRLAYDLSGKRYRTSRPIFVAEDHDRIRRIVEIVNCALVTYPRSKK